MPKSYKCIAQVQYVTKMDSFRDLKENFNCKQVRYLSLLEKRSMKKTELDWEKCVLFKKSYLSLCAFYSLILLLPDFLLIQILLAIFSYPFSTPNLLTFQRVDLTKRSIFCSLTSLLQFFSRTKYRSISFIPTSCPILLNLKNYTINKNMHFWCRIITLAMPTTKNTLVNLTFNIILTRTS